MEFNTVEEAIEAIGNGEIIIVTDDPGRENEGDVVMAAEKVTPEAINFMAKYARGLICLPATKDKLDELKLGPMVQDNTALLSTAYTVSIDAKDNITTGISAYDRAQTILKFVSPDAKPGDFVRPGHIFPLRAVEGGVLRRAGHTEAAVDLARLAGSYPAGVICEIMDEDGTMARVPQLLEFAEKYGLKITTVSHLIKYRNRNDKLIRLVTSANCPTLYGDFRLCVYESVLDKESHIALVRGNIADGEPVLVRVHSQCLTGDVFGSLRCDCGEQIHHAMAMIEEVGKGVIVYMRQEGRGIGLTNKLRAYQLQDKEGLDTVEANEKLGFPADLRDYGIGAQILVDLGVKKMRLMTNNPRKVTGLAGYGLEVVERIQLESEPNKFNRRYLETKRTKLGHLLFNGDN